MADSSLDDFFAKKDKSKKKSKSSKITPNDLTKAATDEPVKKEKKSKKEKDSANTQTSNNSKTIGLTEEEWKEVEEEKEKDYTGLRIANLQVAEGGDSAEEETGEQEEEGEEGEDGEMKERKDRGEQGPWKGSSAPAQTSSTTPPPVPVDEKPKEDSKPTGKYIPPSQRGAAGAAGSGAGPTIPTHLRKLKKNAPNLTSEEDFPTLGGGLQPGGPLDSDTRSFERVQHGGSRQMDDKKTELSLGNKFSALQE